MENKHYLDRFAQLLNREQLQTKSPLAGFWFALSENAEKSDIILEFLEDGTFNIKGNFEVEKEVLEEEDGEPITIIIVNTIKFIGIGEYSFEGSQIKMKGNLSVEQEACNIEYTWATALKEDDFIAKNYTRPIDFCGKFTRTENSDEIKLLFDGDGIINFTDEIDCDILITGFRNFLQVVEIIKITEMEIPYCNE